MAKPRAKQFTVRDISETLGKLPPQAIDIEHAVIGELLSERGALQHVIDFLKPDHFYEETSKEIYSAILSLHRQHVPIDLITVKTYLEKTGKLEIVGGATTLVKLTALITSAANIVYHARIIVEMAIKREMILIASTIHHQGYDDSVDVFEFVEDSMAKIKDLYSRETTPTMEQRVQQLWKETSITEEPPPDVPLVRIDGETMCSIGESSLLVGKKKSRKTLFLILLIKWARQSGNCAPDQIMLFDTEQGRRHVYLLREKIKRVIGEYINVFTLRGRTHRERQEFIETTVAMWPKKPHLIIIDGIRDCQSNINDPDETTLTVQWIENILLRGIHITNVLHLNKTDSNPRGHLGTELANKAQTVFELELTKEGDTEVRCESSRDKPFNPFIFTHDDQGLPEIIGQKISGQTINEDEFKNNLHLIFEGGNLHYSELITGIKAYFKTGDNKAKQHLADFLRRGWIIKSGKDRSKDTIYKLIISSSGNPLTPISPELFPQNGNGHHQETTPTQTEPEISIDDMPF